MPAFFANFHFITYGLEGFRSCYSGDWVCGVSVAEPHDHSGNASAQGSTSTAALDVHE